MPRRSSRSIVRSSRKGRRSQMKPLSDTAKVYNGPVVKPTDQVSRTVVEIVLGDENTLSSSAAGIIANTFPVSNPSGCQNWADYAAVWDQYRVIASRLVYVPSNKYGKTSSSPVCVPGFIVVDRDSSSALTGYSESAGYASNKFVSLEEKFSAEWHMATTEEGLFTTTASPVTDGAFLLFWSGLTVSTEYGRIVTQYRVQFRGVLG
jgi:hypothetical protein